MTYGKIKVFEAIIDSQDKESGRPNLLFEQDKQFEKYVNDLYGSITAMFEITFDKQGDHYKYEIGLELDADLNSNCFDYTLICPEAVQIDDSIMNSLKKLTEYIDQRYIFKVSINPDTLDAEIHIEKIIFNDD